ncbi:helix-turn-helix domain-containing protein [Streptomyces sp. NPDC091280]|uniref:helix-turn-helix domain-containing protein n=1 Tax=Streptomyces sp. NPDC091280 TaxID=3365984 RepID=UPI003814222E
MARGLAVSFDGAALRALRMSRDSRRSESATPLSAQELARRIGATKAQILAYENGLRVPEPPRILALAHALNVHPLKLASPNDYREWDIADLRRACGLTQRDAARRLAVRESTYRRFEIHATLPNSAAIPTFLDKVAVAFDVPLENVVAAVRRGRAVPEHLEQVERSVRHLFSKYGAQPGFWSQPSTDEPDLLALASRYGWSPRSTSWILGSEFKELRRLLLRAEVERVRADYEIDADRQTQARTQHQRSRRTFEESLQRLPIRLENMYMHGRRS